MVQLVLLLSAICDGSWVTAHLQKIWITTPYCWQHFSIR